MSLEIIKSIAETEENGKNRIEQAKLSAKQNIAEAEAKGQALLTQIDNKSAEEFKKQMREAEVRAEARTAKILDEAREKGEAIKQSARAHVEKGAAMIAERIMD